MTPDADRTAPKQSSWFEFLILWGVGTSATLLLYAVIGNPVAGAIGPPFEQLHPAVLLSRKFGVAGFIFELAIAVGIGLFAAHRVGLGAPIIEKRLRGESVSPDVRALLVPSLLVGVLIAVLWSLPPFPTVHHDADASIRLQEQLGHSEALRKLMEQIPAVRMTRTDVFIHSAASAIDGELILRLFGLSLTAWLLSRLAGIPRGTTNFTLVRLSVVLVAMGVLLHDLYGAWMTQRWLRNLLFGVQIPEDPLWVTATHIFVRTVPANLAFGWLYIRRGLEAAMLAALVAGLMNELLFYLVPVWFY